MKNINTELIFTGNELLNGRILNTNSRWLCKNINKLGSIVTRIITVPDNLDLIARNIKISLECNPTFLFICGGLGSTFDDLTLEAVSNALNRPLALNNKALEYLKLNYEYLKKINLIKEFKLDNYKKKMATLPENAIALYNPIGAAPGVQILYKNTHIFCLPGVPAELKSIFRTHIQKIFKQMIGNEKYDKKSFFAEGFIESEITHVSEKVMKDFQGIWVKTFVKSPHIRKAIEFEVSARGNKEEINQKINDAIQKLKEPVIEKGGIILNNGN